MRKIEIKNIFPVSKIVWIFYSVWYSVNILPSSLLCVAFVRAQFASVHHRHQFHIHISHRHNAEQFIHHQRIFPDHTKKFKSLFLPNHPTLRNILFTPRKRKIRTRDTEKEREIERVILEK